MLENFNEDKRKNPMAQFSDFHTGWSILPTVSRVIILSFFLFSSLIFSQNESKNSLAKYQSVGLVLSGGGARGYAHIGVLKVLDSLGVKVDYIVGSSMGAIVGGLYASGYTGHQLDSIVQNFDLFNLINNPVSRRSKPFFEKKERYAFTLPLKQFRFSLPEGVSTGQKVIQKLSELTTHVHDIYDFSDLPIPFFAIATNLETGEEIVLDRGFLPEILYASGSYPTMLAPLKINDMILTDGGIVNNFPVKHLKDKGIDIIIGSNVQDDLRTREELKSFSSILQQISTFQSKKRAKKERKLVNILIHPNVKNFTFFDFNQQGGLIHAGEEGARRYASQLKKITKYQHIHHKKEEVNVKQDEFYITDIQVRGNQRYSKNHILDQMKFRVPKQVANSDINRAIDNLYATGNFRLVKYRLEKHNYGQVLVLDIEESEEKLFLKFGIHYDNAFKTGVLLNTTIKNLLIRNSTTSADLILGDCFRYRLEYYVDRGLKPGFGFKTSFINMPFQRDRELGTETETAALNFNYREYDTDVYANTIISRQFGFFLGAEYKFLDVFTRNIIRNGKKLKIQNNGFLSFYGLLDLDTYDDDLFPTSGVMFDCEFKFIASGRKHLNSEFNQVAIIKGRLEGAFSFSNRLSVRLGTSFGSFIGNHLPPGFEFSLGGYFKQKVNNFEWFYGYKPREIIGEHVIKSDLDIQYKLLKNHYITLHGNIANVSNEIKDLLFTRISHQGVGVGYGIRTLFGPARFIYSYSPSKKESEIYFSLGFWF